MSIASEITRLTNAKADIKAAIEAKGVTVPAAATLDAYPSYVSQIEGGGGSGAQSGIWQDSEGYIHVSELPGSAKIPMDYWKYLVFSED